MASAITIGASLVVAACHRGATNEAGSEAPIAMNTPASLGSAPRELKAQISDSEIVRAIEHVFVRDAALRGRAIGVSSTQGVVMLSGNVENLLAKRRAVRATESVKGVRSVVDSVTIQGDARPDDAIARDVREALSRDPATSDSRVEVDVMGAIAKLAGAADSWQQRAISAQIAESVRGVVDVDNEISIRTGGPHGDAEITSDIKRRLTNDVWLDGASLDVSVDSGAVRLHGVVGSARAKTRAFEAAWVAGTTSVDTSDVSVDWPAHDAVLRATGYSSRPDSQIAVGVRDAFNYDPRTAHAAPHVSATQGVVTLTGVVPNLLARHAAVDDAKNTLGVWDVVDRLTVAPKVARTDLALARDVTKAIADDPFAAKRGFVEVKSVLNGRVTLGGAVASRFDGLEAIADASSVPGVVAVDDKIELDERARAPDVIAEDVRTTLFWDPLVNAERIDVAITPDKVVTLSGTIDDWAAATSARNDALRAGATRVVNQLLLRTRAPRGDE